MPPVPVAAVHLIGHTLDIIIPLIAVGKAVGSDEVQHIFRAETFAIGRSLFPRQQVVGKRGCLPVLAVHQLQFKTSREAILADVEVDEQVVGIAGAEGFRDGDPIMVDNGPEPGQVFAVKHDLQRRIMHAHPPVGRFNAFDGWL